MSKHQTSLLLLLHPRKAYKKYFNQAKLSAHSICTCFDCFFIKLNFNSTRVYRQAIVSRFHAKGFVDSNWKIWFLPRTNPREGGLFFLFDFINFNFIPSIKIHHELVHIFFSLTLFPCLLLYESEHYLQQLFSVREISFIWGFSWYSSCHLV